MEESTNNPPTPEFGRKRTHGNGRKRQEREEVEVEVEMEVEEVEGVRGGGGRVKTERQQLTSQGISQAWLIQCDQRKILIFK